MPQWNHGINPGAPEISANFIPKTPEPFTHVDDGNLSQDGCWTYQWDAENRLISMTSRTELPSTLPRRKIEFVYDYMSRRTVKHVYKETGGATDGGSAGETGDDDSDPGMGTALHDQVRVGRLEPGRGTHRHRRCAAGVLVGAGCVGLRGVDGGGGFSDDL